jgi:hypothetical protein
MYILECGCVTRFVRQSNQVDGASPDQMAEQLTRAACAVEGRPLFLIADSPLPQSQLAAVTAHGIFARLLFQPPRAERNPTVVLYAIETK